MEYCPQCGTRLREMPRSARVTCPNPQCDYDDDLEWVNPTAEEGPRRAPIRWRVLVIAAAVFALVWWGSQPSADPSFDVHRRMAAALSSDGWSCGVDEIDGLYDCFAPPNWSKLWGRLFDGGGDFGNPPP
jgi:hypothetical protein